jgi:hypothetical protein
MVIDRSGASAELHEVILTAGRPSADWSAEYVALTMLKLIRRSIGALAPLLACAFVAGCGGGGVDPPAVAFSNTACGAGTEAAYVATLGAAGARIYSQERHSTAVDAAIAAAQHYQPLISAVESGDVPAVHKAMLHLIYGHLHIVRMRVAAGGKLLGDIGGRHVLGPIHAALRDGSRTVGGFAISIQDDLGYTLLAHRFVGADVIMRDGTQTVWSTLRHPPATLPSSGSFSYFGRRYGIYNYEAYAYPGGPLRISLLFPLPALTALGAEPCGQVVVDTVGRVVQHAYREAAIGPGAKQIDRYVQTYAPLRAAVQQRSAADASAAVQHLLETGHVTHLRVTLNGGPLAEGGPPDMVAPVAGRFPGIPGRFTFATLSAGGFVSLARALTGYDILVRSADGRQLAGTLAPGPASPPAHGTVQYGGTTYGVYSFRASGFDGEPLRVYVMVDARHL